MTTEVGQSIARRPDGQDGIALVVVLMALMLLTALGLTMTLNTSLETLIAGNFRETQEAFYAADAGVERALSDLSADGDWNGILDGSTQSSFVDGAPGPRTLVDGSTVDLAQVANMANCRKPSPCSVAEMDRVTSERPWGANNPRWQLYAYGPVRVLLPAGAIDSAYYLVMMVADDASENDGDPLRDGVSAANPGSDVVALRVDSFGPRGGRKTIEVTVARSRLAGAGGGHVRVLSWRALRVS